MKIRYLTEAVHVGHKKDSTSCISYEHLQICKLLEDIFVWSQFCVKPDEKVQIFDKMNESINFPK